MEGQGHQTLIKDKTNAFSGISVFLYACETWTLTVELEKRVQALEMRCFRRFLGISYKNHITNEEVRNRIKQASGPYEDLLSTIKRRKLIWFWHVITRGGLAKTVLQETVRGEEREEDKRRDGKTTLQNGLD